MSDVLQSDRAEVDRAVALLKIRRGTSNPFKILAIEIKLRDMPDDILTRARARVAGEPKKRAPVTSAQATLKSATLTTTLRDSEPTIKGHNMQFDMVVDPPRRARDVAVGEGEGRFARDLYGVYFEWWEEIVVDYDFTVDPVDDEGDEAAVHRRQALIALKKRGGEGGWEKPWSDIYLSNPQSQTFYSWKASIEKAMKGELTGSAHTTGVLDRPALNLDDKGSFKRRTLRFRINAGDASGPVFKGDAIQVLVVEDGTLASSFYQDSTGTTLKSGTGDSEPMRYRSKVSPEVGRKESGEFVKVVEGSKEGCAEFENLELTEIKEKGKGAELGTVHKDVNQSNRMNVLPLIPGADQYWQKAASDGGLLVAQLSGGKVKRLYHTDNVEREIEVQVSGKATKFTVRTFEQIPLD
jgi:hypothetical protein